MARIRKRNLPSGETRYLVDYRDQNGHRRAKQFKRRKDAERWMATALWEVGQGTHTPDTASITVRQAARLWLERCERDGLEQSTINGYRQHEKYHIAPLIGDRKLSQLTVPALSAYADELLETRSRALVKKVFSSLSAIFSEAQRRGLGSRNPVRDLKIRLPKREASRPVMPTRGELRAIIEHASGRWRPLILTAVFTGLRSSELRGLQWGDVDLRAAVLHVCRRVDQWGNFGPPKSAAGTRSVPLAPIVANTLREWRLKCPKGELDLVFPNSVGKVESHANIINRGFWPIQIAAGIVTERTVTRGGETKTVQRGKYSLHALRHAAAALFIEQGLGPKKIQAIMGHGSIQMTYDTYGYLFDDGEGDQAAMQAIEARLLG